MKQGTHNEPVILLAFQAWTPVRGIQDRYTIRLSIRPEPQIVCDGRISTAHIITAPVLQIFIGQMRLEITLIRADCQVRSGCGGGLNLGASLSKLKRGARTVTDDLLRRAV